MKVFLLIGQSNIAGPAISRWDEEDDKRLDGVLLSNREDEWEPAKNPLNAYSTIKWQPKPGINPGVTFAEEMKKAFPGEVIGIISNSRGASKISEWQKGQWYYNEAVRRVKATCGDEKIDGILWLQGEQDVVDVADYGNYAEKLSRFIYDLREELGGQDIPFIACEIWGDVELAAPEYHIGIREVNRQIAEVVNATENCEMILSAGLEHTVGDEVHFAPEGMRELGRRYAAKYLDVWGK
jgi:hypothetical protein